MPAGRGRSGARRFVAVERIEPAMLRDCTAEQVATGLPGRRIESVERSGKFLIVELDGGAFLDSPPGHDRPVAGRPARIESAHTRFLFRLRGRRQGRSSPWSSATSASSAGFT